MSDKLYAIKDSTLTALGDAVRNKVMGTTELPILECPKTYMSYMGTYIYEMPSFVRKTKIVGKLERPLDDYHTKLKGLGMVPWRTGSVSNARSAEDFVVLVEEVNGYDMAQNYDCDFEITIDSNVFTLLAVSGENATPETHFSFTAIGLDANGNEFKYTPLEMVDAINELNIIPTEALNITGNCQYRFAYGGSDWLIKEYSDKITTKDITDATYMFNQTKVEEIPFEINLKDNTAMEYMFSSATYLKSIPQVNIKRTSHKSNSNLFYNCYKIREIPDWVGDMLEEDASITSSNSNFNPWGSMFANCRSLRRIPDKVMKNMRNPNQSGQYYGILYGKPFVGCYCLDELVNILPDDYTYTSNQFSGWFDNLYRVKNVTFATNEDGTPLVRKWKSQTINFASGWFGWVNGSPSNVTTSVNSGITADKQVTDDATYQALKNDPDWFSCIAKYSRYNHDSAVNTINSLPDTSAYLATAGGTNTIKFYDDSAIGTDEGPASNLTEEEIAVASAKGWSVALV